MSESLFSGLRVIDCGSYIAAPAATTIMAEFGADVIKIEPPGPGDPYRTVSRLPGMPVHDLEYGALMDNRGKRGLAVDLQTAEGQEIIHRLVEGADVFVTNLPLKARDKLRIDYPSLAALNDRLVYGSFTGFGEVGEEIAKPGFDSTAYWARSGMMDQVRPSANDEPAKSVPGQGDHPSAVALYAGLVSALYQRERTGKGSLVRSSLLANGMWANGFMATAALCGAEFVPRPPRRQSKNALSTLYECKDGKWLLLGILNEERYWPVLCGCLGRRDLMLDPRFATKPDRHANATALVEALDAVFALRDRGYWKSVLHEHGIVFEVVTTPSDIAHDEQVALNGYVVPFADAPELRTISTPFTVDGAQKVPATLPPGIGQHTDDLLGEIGYTPEQIAALRESGAVS